LSPIANVINSLGTGTAIGTNLGFQVM